MDITGKIDTNIAQKDSLKALVVRPITSEEENYWNDMMNQHHYLGFRTLTGKTLKYVAVLNDQWVALIGWGLLPSKAATVKNGLAGHKNKRQNG